MADIVEEEGKEQSVTEQWHDWNTLEKDVDYPTYNDESWLSNDWARSTTDPYGGGITQTQYTPQNYPGEESLDLNPGKLTYEQWTTREQGRSGKVYMAEDTVNRINSQKIELMTPAWSEGAIRREFKSSRDAAYKELQWHRMNGSKDNDRINTLVAVLQATQAYAGRGTPLYQYAINSSPSFKAMVEKYEMSGHEVLVNGFSQDGRGFEYSVDFDQKLFARQQARFGEGLKRMPANRPGQIIFWDYKYNEDGTISMKDGQAQLKEYSIQDPKGNYFWDEVSGRPYAVSSGYDQTKTQTNQIVMGNGTVRTIAIGTAHRNPLLESEVLWATTPDYQERVQMQKDYGIFATEAEFADKTWRDMFFKATNVTIEQWKQVFDKAEGKVTDFDVLESVYGAKDVDRIPLDEAVRLIMTDKATPNDLSHRLTVKDKVTLWLGGWTDDTYLRDVMPKQAMDELKMIINTEQRDTMFKDFENIIDKDLLAELHNMSDRSFGAIFDEVSQTFRAFGVPDLGYIYEQLKSGDFTGAGESAFGSTIATIIMANPAIAIALQAARYTAAAGMQLGGSFIDMVTGAQEKSPWTANKNTLTGMSIASKTTGTETFNQYMGVMAGKTTFEEYLKLDSVKEYAPYIERLIANGKVTKEEAQRIAFGIAKKSTDMATLRQARSLSMMPTNMLEESYQKFVDAGVPVSLTAIFNWSGDISLPILGDIGKGGYLSLPIIKGMLGEIPMDLRIVELVAAFGVIPTVIKHTPLIKRVGDARATVALEGAKRGGLRMEAERLKSTLANAKEKLLRDPNEPIFEKGAKPSPARQAVFDIESRIDAMEKQIVKADKDYSKAIKSYRNASSRFNNSLTGRVTFMELINKGHFEPKLAKLFNDAYETVAAPVETIGKKIAIVSDKNVIIKDAIAHQKYQNLAKNYERFNKKLQELKQDLNEEVTAAREVAAESEVKLKLKASGRFGEIANINEVVKQIFPDTAASRIGAALRHIPGMGWIISRGASSAGRVIGSPKFKQTIIGAGKYTGVSAVAKFGRDAMNIVTIYRVARDVSLQKANQVAKVTFVELKRLEDTFMISKGINSTHPIGDIASVRPARNVSTTVPDNPAGYITELREAYKAAEKVRVEVEAKAKPETKPEPAIVEPPDLTMEPPSVAAKGFPVDLSIPINELTQIRNMVQNQVNDATRINDAVKKNAAREDLIRVERILTDAKLIKNADIIGKFYDDPGAMLERANLFVEQAQHYGTDVLPNNAAYNYFIQRALDAVEVADVAVERLQVPRSSAGLDYKTEIGRMRRVIQDNNKNRVTTDLTKPLIREKLVEFDYYQSLYDERNISKIDIDTQLKEKETWKLVDDTQAAIKLREGQLNELYDEIAQNVDKKISREQSLWYESEERLLIGELSLYRDALARYNHNLEVYATMEANGIAGKEFIKRIVPDAKIELFEKDNGLKPGEGEKILQENFMLNLSHYSWNTPGMSVHHAETADWMGQHLGLVRERTIKQAGGTLSGSATELMGTIFMALHEASIAKIAELSKRSVQATQAEMLHGVRFEMNRIGQYVDAGLLPPGWEKYEDIKGFGDKYRVLTDRFNEAVEKAKLNKEDFEIAIEAPAFFDKPTSEAIKYVNKNYGNARRIYAGILAKNLSSQSKQYAALLDNTLMGELSIGKEAFDKLSKKDKAKVIFPIQEQIKIATSVMHLLEHPVTALSAELQVEYLRTAEFFINAADHNLAGLISKAIKKGTVEVVGTGPSSITFANLTAYKYKMAEKVAKADKKVSALSKDLENYSQIADILGDYLYSGTFTLGTTVKGEEIGASIIRQVKSKRISFERTTAPSIDSLDKILELRKELRTASFKRTIAIENEIAALSSQSGKEMAHLPTQEYVDLVTARNLLAESRSINTIEQLEAEVTEINSKLAKGVEKTRDIIDKEKYLEKQKAIVETIAKYDEKISSMPFAEKYTPRTSLLYTQLKGKYDAAADRLDIATKAKNQEKITEATTQINSIREAMGALQGYRGTGDYIKQIKVIFDSKEYKALSRQYKAYEKIIREAQEKIADPKASIGDVVKARKAIEDAIPDKSIARAKRGALIGIPSEVVKGKGGKARTPDVIEIYAAYQTMQKLKRGTSRKLYDMKRYNLRSLEMFDDLIEAKISYRDIGNRPGLENKFRSLRSDMQLDVNQRIAADPAQLKVEQDITSFQNISTVIGQIHSIMLDQPWEVHARGKEARRVFHEVVPTLITKISEETKKLDNESLNKAYSTMTDYYAAMSKYFDRMEVIDGIKSGRYGQAFDTVMTYAPFFEDIKTGKLVSDDPFVQGIKQITDEMQALLVETGIFEKMEKPWGEYMFFPRDAITKRAEFGKLFTDIENTRREIFVDKMMDPAKRSYLEAELRTKIKESTKFYEKPTEPLPPGVEPILTRPGKEGQPSSLYQRHYNLSIEGMREGVIYNIDYMQVLQKYVNDALRAVVDRETGKALSKAIDEGYLPTFAEADFEALHKKVSTYEKLKGQERIDMKMLELIDPELANKYVPTRSLKEYAEDPTTQVGIWMKRNMESPAELRAALTQKLDGYYDLNNVKYEGMRAELTNKKMKLLEDYGISTLDGLPEMMGLDGKLVTLEAVEKIRNEIMPTSKVPAWAKAIVSANQALRMAKAGFDIGWFFIHGLMSYPTASFKGSAWLTAGVDSMKAMLDPMFLKNYYIANADMIVKAVTRANMTFGSAEFVEGAPIIVLPFKALAKGGEAMSKSGVLTKSPVKSMVGGLLERSPEFVDAFERGFTTYLDVIRLEHFKNFYRDSMTPLEANRIGRAIDRMTGVTNRAILGLSYEQFALEQCSLFSPMYTRAGLSLLMSMFSTDAITLRHAWATMARYAGVGVIQTLLLKNLTYALGMNDEKPEMTGDLLDPDVLSVKIGKGEDSIRIKYGGIQTSIFRVALGLARKAADGGDNYVLLKEMPEDMARWVRSRVSPLAGWTTSQALGSNYIGQSTRGWNGILRETVSLGIPFAADGMLETYPQTFSLKAMRGSFELIGFSSRGNNPINSYYDILNSKSKEIYGERWDALDALKQRNLKDTFPEIRAASRKSVEYKLSGLDWTADKERRQIYEWQIEQSNIEDITNSGLGIAEQKLSSGEISRFQYRQIVKDIFATRAELQQQSRVNFPLVYAKFDEPTDWDKEDPTKSYGLINYYIENVTIPFQAQQGNDETFNGPLYKEMNDNFVKLAGGGDKGKEALQYVRDALRSGHGYPAFYREQDAAKDIIYDSGYWDIKRGTVNTYKEQTAFREKNPKVDAALYICGYTDTIQSMEGYVIASNKLYLHGIDEPLPLPDSYSESNRLSQQLKAERDIAYREASNNARQTTAVNALLDARTQLATKMRMSMDTFRETLDPVESRRLADKLYNDLTKFDDAVNLVSRYALEHPEDAWSKYLNKQVEIDRNEVNRNYELYKRRAQQ